MRKFNSTQKSCGWQNVYAALGSRIGTDETEELFRKADRLLAGYEEQYRSMKGTEKMHVSAACAVAALYNPLKERFGEDEARKILEEGAKPESLKKKAGLEKMPARMFLALCRIMTNIFFGEKAGFINQDYSKDKTEIRFDILSCPYYNTLKELGCPEVCPVICIQDEYSYKGMKNADFERTRTIGGGDDRCDFCYKLK